MFQRLIIITDSSKGLLNGATAQERNLITRFLEGKGWDVWHWFEDVWLVVVPDGGIADTKASAMANVPASAIFTKGLGVSAGWVDPAELREEISALFGALSTQRHVLIMAVPDGTITYSGLGPPDGWPWMKAKWGHPK
jgi:hypothetical protein